MGVGPGADSSSAFNNEKLILALKFVFPGGTDLSKQDIREFVPNWQTAH